MRLNLYLLLRFWSNLNMDISEEILRIYWDYLKICAYPDIFKMCEKDVRKIFEKTNRVQFLTWAITALIPQYEFHLKATINSTKKETMLGDILHSNGFCKSFEKNSFVTPQFSMNIHQEMLIFNRIFCALLALHDNFDKENVDEKLKCMKSLLLHPTRNQFEQQILCNDNIFAYTAHKKLTDHERKKIILNYKKLIKDVETDIENLQKKKDDMLQNKFSNLYEYLNTTQEEMKEIATKVNSVTSIFNNDFIEYSSTFLKLPDIPDNSDIGNTLQKTSKYVDHKLKDLEKQEYLEKRNDISTEGGQILDDDFSEFIMKHYILSEEIINKTDDI